MYVCATTEEWCEKEGGVNVSKYGIETTIVGIKKMRGPHILLLYFQYLVAVVTITQNHAHDCYLTHWR